MKKHLLILIMFIASLSYGQTTYRIIASASATSSANYTYTPPTGRIGSIHITTSSTFVGTTGTIALQGSNDGGSNWATVYANDGTTALSFTLTAASTSYIWQFQAVMFDTYRLVYTKGDASAGTISATITTR